MTSLFFLSLFLLIVTALFYKFPPKSMNSIYGYRTGRSMSSQKMWIEGNKYSSILMLKLFVLNFLLTVVLAIISFNYENFYNIAFWIEFIVLMVFLFLSIIKTEKHLKNLEERGD